MARRKKYRVQRGPTARERLHAAICGEVSPAHDAWLAERQKFIDSLPRLSPAEVLALLERPALVATALLFHRLRREVLAAPDGREMFDAFGRRWMELYGGGRLPGDWWDGWPDDLRVYGGE
jgi:hypothetical protein